MMKTMIRTAMMATLMIGAATTGLMVSGPAFAAKKEAKPAGPQYTKAVQVALIAAQKAQTGGDLVGAAAQLAIADAAKTTADDILAVGQTTINLGLATKDNALLEKGLEVALSSGKVAATEVPKYYRNLGAIALQRNDYVKAIRAYQELEKVAPAGGEIAVNLAEMYQRTKQTPLAVASFARGIADKKATGEVVPEVWYRRSLAIAYDAKLPNETLATSLALVSAYPNPTNWRDVLTIFRDGAKFDDQGSIDVMRLQRAVGALAGERDFAEYADTASQRGLPGEAKAVLDEGIAKGMLSAAKPFIKDLQVNLGARVPKDKASLPALEKEAKAGPNAKLMAAVGDGFLGYANYPKAAEAYQLALTKKGADLVVINTRLGIALALAGDKAGASTAFGAIKGGARETLAKFWLVYLANKA